MNSELLEKVLACPSLPSLPAVALRVIELTSDANVRLNQLAVTIQNDQGLAAKILKTVNSSFYALRQPCGTISKAIVMLGLAPVKALALGFSLVQSVGADQNGAFDYVAYWRRGLYTATAAKAIAEAAGRPFAEEAFLAGLLQDLGVLAMHRALGKDYARTLERAGGDHRNLVKAELADWETQHPEVGAALVKRWKLPDELAIPVRFHERPTAAPQEHTDLARCVGLANFAHDVLTDADPRPALTRLYERGSQWFGLDRPSVDAVLKRVGEGVREMSRLFNLDTGPFSGAEAVLDRARQQQERVVASEVGGDDPEPGMTVLVNGAAEEDPLTGALPRAAYDSLVRRALAEAGKPLALANVAVDGHGERGREGGVDAADAAVVRVAEALKDRFGPAGGSVCRVSGEVFAVIAPGVERGRMLELLAAVRADLSSGPSPLNVSAGVVAVPARAQGEGPTPVEFAVAGAKALQAARQAGGNRVALHGERATAA